MENRKEISMNETLTKLYIKSVTKDEHMTQKIMSFIFKDVSEYKFMKCHKGHFFKTSESFCPYCKEEKVDVVQDYKLDKKSEILESLKYLKSKEHKTKKDLESIYTLEVVLKNFR